MAPSPGVVPDLSPAEQAIADGLVASHGLSEGDARVLAQDAGLLAFFTATAAESGDAAAAANWVVNDVRAVAKEHPLATLRLDGVGVGRIIKLVASGTISTRIARDVLVVMVADGGDPKAIVDARGWAQVSDEDALATTIAAVLAANPGQVAAYRGGKTQLKGFFVGQVMRATRGRANPGLVQRLLGEQLEGGA